jgi:hypothetical protein
MMPGMSRGKDEAEVLDVVRVIHSLPVWDRPNDPGVLPMSEMLAIIDRLQSPMNGKTLDSIKRDFARLRELAFQLEVGVNESVLQDWVVALPIRMQSTLVLSLRGPDGYNVPNVRAWVRWLRGHAFKPGNPNNVRNFMLDTEPPQLVEKGMLARELETLPQHFYGHLMHSVEVVAYRHPDPAVSRRAYEMYEGMCDLMHVSVEDDFHFNERLRALGWPEGQPDTAAEAITQIERHAIAGTGVN